MGSSKYAGQDLVPGVKVTDSLVEAIREVWGGNLQPLPQTKLEWFQEEVDAASKLADEGDLSQAARLKRACVRDPIINGLLATKSGGIIRLPKKWSGSQVVVDSLMSKDGGIPRFDLMCPPQELKAMADDSDFLGVSYGELIEVPGRHYPVLERKDPEFLYYRWSTNTWHMRSNAALLDIDPGQGNWVLHLQGPRIAPWQSAKWHALGRSWVRKDQAQHLKQNWMWKLANAARVAVSPKGASKDMRNNWFKQVASWGINTTFSVVNGWDVKLIESNGRGWEGFDTSIKDSNEDFMIGLAGQLVSITGGTGFSSEDLYASVRYDLIREVAVPLGYTISTQILPWYTYLNFPEEMDDSPCLEFEVKKPSDLTAEASIYTALGAGLQALQEVAATAGLAIDVAKFFQKFGIPTTELSEDEARKLVEMMASKASNLNDHDSNKQAAILYTLGKAIRERQAA